MLSVYLFYIFVSRSFPLPSAFQSTDIERGKVFGLNTLRRRKIHSETACRLTFQLSRAIVHQCKSRKYVEIRTVANSLPRS